MSGQPSQRATIGGFEQVARIGLSLPDAEAVVRYDGATVLKVGGSFFAGIASHPSAEPGTLVVRCDIQARDWLLEEAPDTYYLTDFYRKYPLVLVRLARVDRAALQDLLSVSHRLTLAKRGKPVARRARS